MLRLILATLHLLALGIGFGAIIDRGVALRGSLDAAGIRRVLRADTAWGIAAILWISTGLLRAFAGFEKGSAYYLGSTSFRYKMLFLGLILILEVLTAATFVGWRRALAKQSPVESGRARLFSFTSGIQALLLVLMVFAATAMARGI